MWAGLKNNNGSLLRTDNARTLTIDFVADTEEIEIIGTFVVPEFGTMTTVMPTAEAEPIPSPYQQVRDGVPIGEIVCAGDRMLMLSPSGKPACVFAGSVEVLETARIRTAIRGAP